MIHTQHTKLPAYIYGSTSAMSQESGFKSCNLWGNIGWRLPSLCEVLELDLVLNTWDEVKLVGIGAGKSGC